MHCAPLSWQLEREDKMEDSLLPGLLFKGRNRCVKTTDVVVVVVYYCHFYGLNPRAELPSLLLYIR